MQEENIYYIEERIWANKENIKNANQIEIAAFGIFPVLTSVILSAYELPKLVAGTSLCSLFAGTILFLWYIRLKGRDFRMLIRKLHKFKIGILTEEPDVAKNLKTRIILIAAIVLYVLSSLISLSFVFIGK